MRWLKVLALVQSLVLLPLLLRFLLAPLDFSALGVWFIAVGVAALTVPIGVWQAVRYPPRRAWAFWLIVLGVLVVTLPLALSHFDVGPIPLPAAITVSAAVALTASAWLLAQAAFRSRAEGSGPTRLDPWITAVLLVAPVAALLPWVSVAVFGFPTPLGRRSGGPGFDLLLVYSATIALVAGLVGFYGLIHALVRLRRDTERRIRHLVHLLLALLTLLMAWLLVLLFGILITNPG